MFLIQIFLNLLLIFFILNPLPVQADQFRVKPIGTEYIVALGDPGASQGVGAETWGLWHQDPGPRGCLLDDYPKLQASGGIAPAQWTFDKKDWWLEEHGLIMEKPVFPLPVGQYIVTGGRAVTALLTIYPKDKEGQTHWSLGQGAKLYDVTHLPCHAARYQPAGDPEECSPVKAERSFFPVAPGVPMPAIKGCQKKEYAVLFVIGIAVKE